MIYTAEKTHPPNEREGIRTVDRATRGIHIHHGNSTYPYSVYILVLSTPVSYSVSIRTMQNNYEPPTRSTSRKFLICPAALHLYVRLPETPGVLRVYFRLLLGDSHSQNLPNLLFYLNPQTVPTMALPIVLRESLRLSIPNRAWIWILSPLTRPIIVCSPFRVSHDA